MHIYYIIEYIILILIEDSFVSKCVER